MDGHFALFPTEQQWLQEKRVSVNFAAAGRRAKMQAQQMTPWKKKNNKTSVVFVCQGKNKVSPHGILPWC